MPADIVRVEEVHAATDEVVDAVQRLLPQLSSSASLPSAAGLAALLDERAVHVFAARLDGATAPSGIVGLALLVTFSTLTGRRAMLEDVIVDGAVGRRGIGRRLVETILATAKDERCRTVDLTSRPSREAANRLYARCGFVQRTTNVWRHELDDPGASPL